MKKIALAVAALFASTAIAATPARIPLSFIITANTDVLSIGQLNLNGVAGIALNANGGRITNVGTPTSSGDAVTKGYADALSCNACVTGVTASSPLISSGGAAPNITLNQALLAITSGQVSGLGALALLGSVDLSGSLATGILAAARFPALSGPVTTTAGSLTTHIANGAITDAMIANSGASAGSYGDSSHVATFTVNSAGIITGATGTAIAFPPSAPGGATTAIQYNLSGTFAGDASQMSFDGSNVLFSPTANFTVSAGSSVGLSDVAGSNLVMDGSGNVSINVAGGGFTLNVPGPASFMNFAAGGGVQITPAGNFSLNGQYTSSITMLDMSGAGALTDGGGGSMIRSNNGSQFSLDDSGGVTISGGTNTGGVSIYTNSGPVSIQSSDNNPITMSSQNSSILLTTNDGTGVAVNPDGTFQIEVSQRIDIASANSGVYLSGNGSTLQLDGSGAPGAIFNSNSGYEFQVGSVNYFSYDPNTGNVLLQTDLIGFGDVDCLSAGNVNFTASNRVNLESAGGNYIHIDSGFVIGAGGGGVVTILGAELDLDSTKIVSWGGGANVAGDGSGNFNVKSGGTQVAQFGTSNVTLSEPLIALSEYTSPVTPSASQIDWKQSNVFVKSISANTTFTFANTQSGQSITVYVTDTNSSTVTWPTIRWPGASTPVQTVSGRAMYQIRNVAGTFYGVATLNM